MKSNPRMALVLGANGGIGGEVTRALLRHGWRVRALTRRMPSAVQQRAQPQIEWEYGDALNREDVVAAAIGTATIVHAVNPPKYHNWLGLALPMLENTIAAADVSGARILFPGTVYNYGLEAFPSIDENSPQSPHTRKGAIRVQMEERLRDAGWDHGVRTLIVRSGDYFGARAGSSWLSQGIVTRGQPVRFVLRPGKDDHYHSWAYLPDLAETMVRLLESEDRLQRFDTFHFKGHWLRNDEVTRAICDLAGIGRQRVLPFPWWAMHASAPFVELSREMLEMQYLWNESLALDNTKLTSLLGSEPHTPFATAMRTTLIGLGCIAESASTRPQTAV